MKNKILIIEDDTILRENTAELLMLANYEVITAENGKTGIEKAKILKPDLIICDILMPELDGYGVLQIMMRNKQLQKIPVIFMTAKTSHEDYRRGMDLGASDYITKPFEESELLSAVASRIKQKKIFEKKHTESDIQLKKQIRAEDLGKVFSNHRKYQYKKGSTVFCEGNNSNYIFYVVKGSVKTGKINEDGKEFITGIFRDGSLFGFTSFLHNKPYQENAVAIKNTTLLRITKKEFVEMIKNSPQMAVHFIDLLAEDIDRIKAYLVHLVYDSVRKKTAGVLLQLDKIKGIDPSIEISRADLASMIGIAKETLIRTLTEFKEEKIIETKRNTIRIKDPEKLKKIR